MRTLRLSLLITEAKEIRAKELHFPQLTERDFKAALSILEAILSTAKSETEKWIPGKGKYHEKDKQRPRLIPLADLSHTLTEKELALIEKVCQNAKEGKEE